MSYRGGDAVRYKERLLQIRPQQNATQLTCAEYYQFLVRKFRGHGECFVEQREICLVRLPTLCRLPSRRNRLCGLSHWLHSPTEPVLSEAEGLGMTSGTRIATSPHHTRRGRARGNRKLPNSVRSLNCRSGRRPTGAGLLRI